MSGGEMTMRNDFDRERITVTHHNKKKGSGYFSFHEKRNFSSVHIFFDLTSWTPINAKQRFTQIRATKVQWSIRGLGSKKLNIRVLKSKSAHKRDRKAGLGIERAEWVARSSLGGRKDRTSASVPWFSILIVESSEKKNEQWEKGPLLHPFGQLISASYTNLKKGIDIVIVT